MSIMFSALAKKLKQCISNLYEKSLFCSVCQKVSQKYVKNINSSLFVDFFTAYDRSDNSYEKIAGKLNVFFCLLTKPFRFIGKVAMSSLFVNEVKKLLENILFVSLRAFGILALPFGVIGLVSSALDYPGVIVTTLYLFLCMFSAFALLYNKSISCMVNESRLCSLLKIRLPQRECVQYKALLMFFIGLVFGIVSLFTGILPVILAVFLIVAVSVGLYMPLFWTTVLFAFVLPFMPTMVMVAGSLALVLCMFMRNITDHYNFNTKGSVLNIYVALMCFVYVLGVAASVHPASSLKISMVYIAFILSYFVITKALDSLKKLKIFISAMAIASIPVSIYGIYQKLTGFDNENTWLDSEMFENISGRIVSFFDNPNVFGEYIILLFMICIGLMFLSRKGSIKLIYLVIAALLGICMIFTYSRGCWIGLIIAVCVFLFFVNKKLLGAVIVIGLISLFFLPDSIIGRISSVGNLADSSTSYRVYIWNGTFEMLKDYWVTGIGVGSDAFNTVYPLYAYSAITAPHPHNLYLLILSETGIVGMLVFVAVVLSLFNKLLHVVKYTENRDFRIIAVAIGSGLTGFLVQGMFDNVWYNYRVFLLFWIIVAVGASVYNVYRKETAE